MGVVVPDRCFYRCYRLKVTAVVRLLQTRSEISAAALGEPRPVDVLAVAALEVAPVELQAEGPIRIRSQNEVDEFARSRKILERIMNPPNENPP